MRLPPASVIASWPKPNYVDPEVRGHGLLVTLVAFTVVVMLVVSTRFYSRIVASQRLFGWDDGLMIPAVFFTVNTNGLVIAAQMKYGWNRHEWDLAPGMIEGANIHAFIAKLTFLLGSVFCRLSIICFYYRLVKDSDSKWFRWLLHASFFINATTGLTFTILCIFACTPIQAYWVWPPIQDGYCIDEGAEVMSMAIVFVVLDLLTTLTPIPLVMKLQMPLKQRIAACVLLSLGIVVTLAGIVRTYFVWKSLIAEWDETWWAYPLWMCAAVELDVAVICASAPALRSLLNGHGTQCVGKKASKLNSRHSSSPTQPESSYADSQSSGSRSWNPFRSGRPRHLEEGEKAESARDHSFPKFALQANVKEVSSRPWKLGKTGTAHAPTAVPKLVIEQRRSIDQQSSYVGKMSFMPRLGLPPTAEIESQMWRFQSSVSAGHENR